jgi:hypothetical protein
MQKNGNRVVRVAAVNVRRDVEAVAASIVTLAATPLHHPRRGEE